MKKIAVSIRKEKLRGGLGLVLTAISNVSEADLFARTPFSLATRQHLAKSRVVVIGAGTGGARIVFHLACAGVGHIVILDPDRFSEVNALRHLMSLLAVGEYKVYAVAEFALQHNSTATIEAYPLDIFDPHSPISPQEILRGADLVIAATDKTSAQLQTNKVAWDLGIPGIFGGCYESARGGEVLITLPGEGTPCLSCLRGGLAPPPPQGPFDYSGAQSAEDYQGEPGLTAAIDLITDIEAQLALGVLLRHTDSPLVKLIDPRYNFLLIGGALAAGYYHFARPFHIFWQPLTGPRPDCDVCQKKNSQLDSSVPIGSEIPAEYQSFMRNGEADTT